MLPCFSSKTSFAGALGIMRSTLENRLISKEIVPDAMDIKGQPLFLTSQIETLRKEEDQKRYARGIKREVLRERSIKRNASALTAEPKI